MLGLWFGSLGGVAAGQPPQRHPPADPVHQILLGVFRYRLVDRERDVLPLAAALAVDQRGDDPGCQLLAGDVIGVPDLRRDRRRVVFEIRIGIVAAIHHRPAQGEVDQVRALEVLPRPVVAKRRHPRGDELRETRVERCVVEPEHLVERAAAGVEQDVGAAEQAAAYVPGRPRPAGRARPISCCGCSSRRTASVRDPAGLRETVRSAGGIAFGRFDLDHLGAEPGEQQPGIFGALVGDLDYPQAGQHAGSGIAHHFARSGRQTARCDHGLLCHGLLLQSHFRPDRRRYRNSPQKSCCHCECCEAISGRRGLNPLRDCFVGLRPLAMTAFLFV